MKRTPAIWLFMLCALLGVIFSPTLAQDETAEDSMLVELVGTVEVREDDLLVVDGVTVAPSGAFIPATLAVGDTVLITGYFNDEGTLMATSIEIVLDADADGVADSLDNCPLVANPDQFDSDADDIGDACDPDLLDSDADGVADSLDNCPLIANPDQFDSDLDNIGDACETAETTCVGTSTHPVAAKIATEFGIAYETVIAWHCQGFGFGNIVIALRLAAELETDADTLLQQFAEGQGGWGVLMKEAGVHPADFFSRRVIFGRNDESETAENRGKAGQSGNGGQGGPPPHAGPPGNGGQGGPPPHAGPPGNGGQGGPPGGGPPKGR